VFSFTMPSLVYALLMISLPANSFTVVVRPHGHRSTSHPSPRLIRERRWQSDERLFQIQRSYKSDNRSEDIHSPEITPGASRSLDVEDDGDSSPWWRQASALALLNVVTLVWGTQHSVIKVAIESPAGSPAILTLARFGLAALLFAPWLPLPDITQNSLGSSSDVVEVPPTGGATSEGSRSSGVSRPSVNSVWLAGAELGLWMFAGYALQAVRRSTCVDRSKPDRCLMYSCITAL